MTVERHNLYLTRQVKLYMIAGYFSALIFKG